MISTSKSMAIASLLMLFILGSCQNQSEDQEQAKKISKRTQIETPAFLDSMKTGTKVTIKGKEFIPDSGTRQVIRKLGKGTKDSALLGVITLGSPKSSKLTTSPAQIVVPDGDSIPFPKVVKATGKSIEIHIPSRTEALDPRFKDASNANIQYLDVDQGMISSYINCVLEDQAGNLWLGTEGGLSKYDGRYFTHFTEINGLSSSRISSLEEDNNGNIWIGTVGSGINIFNGKSLTQFNESNGLSNNSIMTIFKDDKGLIWIGTRGGGVNKFNGKSFEHITTKNGLSNDVVRSIFQDRSGKIWMGTAGGGVTTYDGKAYSRFGEKEGISDNILSIIQDREDNMWFGTIEGLMKYSGDSVLKFTEKEGLTSNTVMSVLEGEDGSIWCGTWNGGLNRIKDNTVAFIKEEDGLSSNRIYSINQDNAGNLWIATDGGGVCRYDMNSFIHLTEEEGLSHPVVRSVFEDKKGNIWMGTDGGGLSKYDGEYFTHYKYNEDGISDNSILAIAEDSKGVLWIGTNTGGVTRLEGDSITWFMEDNGMSGNTVTSILIENDNNIWFGTWGGGVTLYKDNKFTHFTTKEGLTHDVIRTIVKDKNGNIWIGTYGGGISKYDGESFTHYTSKEGLSSNSVMSIFEDHQGIIWVGTYGGGLNRFDGSSFVSITTQDGLSDNIIWSIEEDQYQNLWVSTENGLNNLILKGDSTVQVQNNTMFTLPEILTFGKRDGLKGTDFFSNSSLVDSKNRIWWGTGKCLSMLDLDLYNLNATRPMLKLNSLALKQQNIDFRELEDSIQVKGNWMVNGSNKVNLNRIGFSGVNERYNYPEDLELPHNINHLTFEFMAVDWAAPHKIRYQYKMQGWDKGWNNLTTETRADYRNIPYGNFTFMVRALGKDKVFSEPITYDFTIYPPWWLTIWAKIAYGVLGVLLIGGIIQWRTAALKKKQRELEKIVAERTKEVQEQLKRSDELLLNILPSEVAEELKASGEVEAKDFDEVSILFTDFKEFTKVSEELSAKELVSEIHACFKGFDEIISRHGIEKIKTIGDAYMAAAGLHKGTASNAKDMVNAALEMKEFLEKRSDILESEGKKGFKMRVGIHTGPVVAGVVGVKKFQYDIWGDTVNTASRMESSGEVGKVNLSKSTYDIVKDDSNLVFESRGKVQAKGKGEMDMFFVSKDD
jgi:ligand-binding sensor domain-containing protein/class 3 adenylate cyclase